MTCLQTLHQSDMTIQFDISIPLKQNKKLPNRFDKIRRSQRKVSKAEVKEYLRFYYFLSTIICFHFHYCHNIWGFIIFYQQLFGFTFISVIIFEVLLFSINNYFFSFLREMKRIHFISKMSGHALDQFYLTFRMLLEIMSRSHTVTRMNR